MRKYWLVKSEPEAFAWADLERAPQQTTCWDGVRNYQARNSLRDGMEVGDGVLFYQSCTKPLGIVGTMEVVRKGYPDPTQFLPDHPGFDPGSGQQNPRWWAVDVRLCRKFAAVLTLDALRQEPGLATMALLRKGSRLSVQPVDAEAWRAVLRLGA